MPKNPESKSKKEPALTPEESYLRIQIEEKIMERSPIKDEKEWVEKNAVKFAEIFKSHKEEILKLHAQNPETAYKKIEELIDEE